MGPHLLTLVGSLWSWRLIMSVVRSVANSVIHQKTTAKIESSRWPNSSQEI